MGYAGSDGSTGYGGEFYPYAIDVTGTNGSTASGSSIVFVKSGEGSADVNVSEGEDGVINASVVGSGGGGGEGGNVTFVGTDGSTYTGSYVKFERAEYANVSVSFDADGTAKIGCFYV